MDDLCYLLCQLNIVVNKYEYNEEYVLFSFDNYTMFVKFIKHVTDCNMSTELSKNIHTLWLIEIINNDNIIQNMMTLVNNFSDGELDKIIESQNKEYLVRFPYAILSHIIIHLNTKYEFNYVESDPCFMECTETSYDFSDDLIYSDDEL